MRDVLACQDCEKSVTEEKSDFILEEYLPGSGQVLHGHRALRAACGEGEAPDAVRDVYDLWFLRQQGGEGAHGDRAGGGGGQGAGAASGVLGVPYGDVWTSLRCDLPGAARGRVTYIAKESFGTVGYLK